MLRLNIASACAVSTSVELLTGSCRLRSACSATAACEMRSGSARGGRRRTREDTVGPLPASGTGPGTPLPSVQDDRVLMTGLASGSSTGPEMRSSSLAARWA
eukprot:364426-Chlamydomonas_euryale.AAC.4